MPLKNQKSESFVMKKEMEDLEKLKKILAIHSYHSLFEDDKWVMDKKMENQRGTKGSKTLYFKSVSLKYKQSVKVFALVRLSENIGVSAIVSNIYGIIKFFTYLADELNDYPLSNVNKKVVLGFKEYVDNLPLKTRTKEGIWTGVSQFYKTLSSYDEIGKIVFGINPYSEPHYKRKSSKKYVDENILRQLDSVFYDKKIPLVYRAAYWICRLIPSRITEVASMRIGSIKPYMNEIVITIPSFKQNGGHKEPETRQIAVKDEGMGGFLLELIREQEKASIAIQPLLNKEDNGFLFTHITSIYVPRRKVYVEHTQGSNRITILNQPNFNNNIKRYCKRYNVTDENGEVANISSHVLRHHGITDRIYEGFRIIDIMSMTNHKSSKMITDTYIHIQEDELRKKTEKILKEDKPTETFRGKIFDTDNSAKESRILSRPFAHKVGRLGLCSDISNCPSEMFECFSCHNFLPNVNELDYFLEQVKQWEDKAKKFVDHQFMRENAVYNIDLNKAIVEKILKMLEEGGSVEK